MSIVARKYAQAIFQCGREQGKLKQYKAEFSALGTALEQSVYLRRLLFYPRITPEQKVKLLEQVCQLTFSPETTNLLILLFKRGRAKELGKVAQEFAMLIAEHENVLEVRVATAVDLPKKLETLLQQRLEKLTGKRILLRTVTDPTLIGGMVLTMGDRVIDGSIRTFLQALRRELVYH